MRDKRAEGCIENLLVSETCLTHGAHIWALCLHVSAVNYWIQEVHLWQCLVLAPIATYPCSLCNCCVCAVMGTHEHIDSNVSSDLLMLFCSNRL